VYIHHSSIFHGPTVVKIRIWVTTISRLTCKYQEISIIQRYNHQKSVLKIKEDVLNAKEDYGSVPSKDIF
jgi:hypothetical protein